MKWPKWLRLSLRELLLLMFVVAFGLNWWIQYQQMQAWRSRAYNLRTLIEQRWDMTIPWDEDDQIMEEPAHIE